MVLTVGITDLQNSNASFMRITFEQLQNDLIGKEKSEKKLKERVSTLRETLTKYRDDEKRLIVQYERLIKDWRIRYDALITNGWKIVFAKIIIWYNNKRGKKTF